MQDILEVLKALRKFNIESVLNIFYLNNMNYYCTGELHTDEIREIIFIITEKGVEIYWEVFEKADITTFEGSLILDNINYLHELLIKEVGGQYK